MGGVCVVRDGKQPAFLNRLPPNDVHDRLLLLDFRCKFRNSICSLCTESGTWIKGGVGGVVLSNASEMGKGGGCAENAINNV